MVNQSKSKDSRFWNKWQKSGAVENMHAASERQFSRYMSNLFSVVPVIENRFQESQSLSGIEQALESGCKIHGFLSGGGLRVVRIEQDGILKGYGEHPIVDHALCHANEDFLAGGRDYNTVYGKQYPHYVTGSSSTTSPLDSWLRQGQTFDAYIDNGQVILELQGYGKTEIPQSVTKSIDETGQPISWISREYTFETSKSRFPNGESCYSTRIIKSPEEKRSGADPWMYKIVKTGMGKSLTEALESAFNAKEVETRRQ